MFKKNLILLISMTLILSLNACGEGTTTVKVTNEDGSTSTVVLESLRTQIQNATPLVDYAENTPIDQMETITFGLDEDGKPIEWIVLEKDNKKALLFKKYMEGFKSYHHESVSWENSLIRNYLNSEWMKETFNKKEQNAIILTNVVNNESDPEYKTRNQNNTINKKNRRSI